MLGYTQEDIINMQDAITRAQKFYLKYPSDLMPKDKFIAELEQVNSFLDGLWAEGYFDNATIN
jgi:hypothetical protein